MSEALRKAASAVVARWDSPDWKDGTHTADYINALRAALAEPEQEQSDSVREFQLRCVIADLKTQVQERDAVLKQALESLEGWKKAQNYTSRINALNPGDEAIAAIKEILK